MKTTFSQQLKTTYSQQRNQPIKKERKQEWRCRLTLGEAHDGMQWSDQIYKVRAQALNLKQQNI